jgi:hypothetical protein
MTNEDIQRGQESTLFLDRQMAFAGVIVPGG